MLYSGGYKVKTFFISLNISKSIDQGSDDSTICTLDEADIKLVLL